MRIMEELIYEHADISEELHERIFDRPGKGNSDLDYYSEMDEASDEEDPEATLRQQVAELRQEPTDQRAFLEASQAILEACAMRTDLERARMQLEDIRSQTTRGK